mmetsp:Transcript_37769/g.33791  ORF Transcript_37769/g.33791 Transcript_37769/m.33791 type:complete len:91 (+) Transcript_37769:40-312(+)
MNATVRENIIFTSKFDEFTYKRILEICELEADIKHLPGGDLAEIGENSLNLSGGQAARINLARALYHDADIFVFDECLSQLDASIAKKIF